MAQVDSAGGGGERDAGAGRLAVLVVVAVAHFPGGYSVDDAAAGLGGDIDDRAVADGVAAPSRLAGDMEGGIEGEECLAGLWGADDQAGFAGIDQSFDDAAAVEIRMDLGEMDELDFALLGETLVAYAGEIVEGIAHRVAPVRLSRSRAAAHSTMRRTSSSGSGGLQCVRFHE